MANMKSQRGVEAAGAASSEDLISMNAYGKHQGVSHTAVRKAVDSGRLSKSVVRDGDKILINKTLADVEWLKNTDKAKQGARKQAEGSASTTTTTNVSKVEQLASKVVDSGTASSVKAQASELLNNMVNEGVLDINEARALKETFLARMAQLEYNRKLGLLVENAVVRKTAFAIANTVKGRLSALPSRIAPQVLGQTETAVIAGLIQAEVNQCLTELAQLVMDIQKSLSGQDVASLKKQAAAEEAELSSLDGEEYSEDSVDEGVI